MDFRNQKVSDVIYALADICEESVFVDETVNGNVTFHFEDKVLFQGFVIIAIFM